MTPCQFMVSPSLLSEVNDIPLHRWSTVCLLNGLKALRFLPLSGDEQMRGLLEYTWVFLWIRELVSVS